MSRRTPIGPLPQIIKTPEVIVNPAPGTPRRATPIPGRANRPAVVLVDAHVCLDMTPQVASLPARRPEAPHPPVIARDGSVRETGTSRQPLAVYPELMWNTGQTLRVKMMGASALVQSKVRELAREWMSYANINFEFVDRSQPAEIKIGFEKGGSWSKLGRDALGVPFDYATMNFGWFDDSTDDAELRRVVLHEFGHALGLIHEHQAPTSGIQWDREKTYVFYKTHFNWDRAKVDSQVFDKYAVSSTNYSTFDPQSIMAYPVDAGLTLDGKGIAGGRDLSATDKEFIGRWYPFPNVAGRSDGLLHTGDDCDEIDFAVEYNVAGGDDVEFRLETSPGIWWKAVEVPLKGGGTRMLEVQDGASATQTIARAQLDTSRQMQFWKAKKFGVHTRLGYTWNVIFALVGGSRVTLHWKRDRC